MRVKEGSIVPVNLRCGHGQVNVVLLNGVTRVRCTKCGKDTEILIKINENGEVDNFDVRWG